MTRDALVSSFLLVGLVAAAVAEAQAPPAAAASAIRPGGDAHLSLGPEAPAAAQAAFDRGLDLLHCFWDFEAARAFREAAAAAPDLALPHLGLWLALGPNRVERSEERQRAMATARASAEDEAPRIRELVRLYAEHAGGAPAAELEAGLEALARQDPDGRELRLLRARELILGTTGHVHRGDEPVAPLGAARAIAEEAIAEDPDSLAAHHYRIHAHELLGDPEGALASADYLRRAKPACGHLRHMPGHVDYLLGDYEAARVAFLDAHAFDRAYLEQSGVSPLDHWNYVHNLTYLVAADAEAGRHREALRWAAELAGLPVSPHRGMSLGLGYVVYGGLTAEARVHWRFSEWGAAAAALEAHLSAPALPSQEAGAYLVGLAAYLRAREAVAADDLTTAERYRQMLFGVISSLAEREPTLGSDWYFDPARRVLAVAGMELAGVILSRRGEHDAALETLGRADLMQRALGYAEPPHYPVPVSETLGHALVRAGRFAAAREAFAATLEQRPESGFAWAGIARAHAGAGDETAARHARERARRAWAAADPEVLARIAEDRPTAPVPGER